MGVKSTTTFTVEVPENGEPERGVRVGCDAHDEWTEFEPGYRGGTFYCETCAFELEIDLHDLLDWRDLGEEC